MFRIPRVSISMRELDRLKCIQGLIDKQRKQKAVAERLGLTVRQVRRLVVRPPANGCAYHALVVISMRELDRQPSQSLHEWTHHRALSPKRKPHTVIRIIIPNSPKHNMYCNVYLIRDVCPALRKSPVLEDKRHPGCVPVQSTNRRRTKFGNSHTLVSA